MRGRVLCGRYELLERIASGGMAEVYRAVHLPSEQLVAVKLLLQHLCEDAAFVERFRREARTQATLDHPHIVKVYAQGEVDGRPYLVMDLVDGESLASLLRRTGPLPADRTIAIIGDVLDALAYAHEHDLIHRDVKPQNVLIDRDGRARLIDFGIAQISTAGTVTIAGEVLGSLHYLAPERFDGMPATPATDLYSVGVMAYQLLTGVLPFHGETPAEVLAQHQRSLSPPPSSIRLGIPPALDTVVLRALAKRPQDRYASAGEMLKALTAATNQLQAHDASTVRIPPSGSPVVPRPGEAIPSDTSIGTERSATPAAGSHDQPDSSTMPTASPDDQPDQRRTRTVIPVGSGEFVEPVSDDRGRAERHAAPPLVRSECVEPSDIRRDAPNLRARSDSVRGEPVEPSSLRHKALDSHGPRGAGRRSASGSWAAGVARSANPASRRLQLGMPGAAAVLALAGGLLLLLVVWQFLLPGEGSGEPVAAGAAAAAGQTQRQPSGTQSAGPMPDPSAVAAWEPRISVVLPHDGQGGEVSAEHSRAVDLVIWPSRRISCSAPADGIVLWLARNGDPARPAPTEATTASHTIPGATFPTLQLKNVPADLEADPAAVYHFFVPFQSNVWVHTLNPAPRLPEPVAPTGHGDRNPKEIDSRIQSVVLYDQDGQRASPDRAVRADIAVDLFVHGTRQSVQSDYEADLVLYVAEGNGPLHPLDGRSGPHRVATRTTYDADGTSYPRWVFESVPVNPDQPAHFMVRVARSDVVTHPVVWSFGRDIRTILPNPDPAPDCSQ